MKFVKLGRGPSNFRGDRNEAVAVDLLPGEVFRMAISSFFRGGLRSDMVLVKGKTVCFSIFEAVLASDAASTDVDCFLPEDRLSCFCANLIAGGTTSVIGTTALRGGRRLANHAFRDVYLGTSI